MTDDTPGTHAEEDDSVAFVVDDEDQAADDENGDGDSPWVATLADGSEVGQPNAVATEIGGQRVVSWRPA